MDSQPTAFLPPSGIDTPRLEFVFQIKLSWDRVQNIHNMPSGAGRGAVYVSEGVISGPKLNGRVVPNSGGDYSLFRPDEVLAFDARYMLEADDGELIMMYNHGYLWGRTPEVMPRIREWMFNNGAPVEHHEYYLRNYPHFECATGRHDWLMRHVIVGIGERQSEGNTIRYFALA